MKKIIESLKATMMVAAFAALGTFTACSGDSKDDSTQAATAAKSGTVTMTCYSTEALPKYADAKFVYTIDGEEKSIDISESDWKKVTYTQDYTAFETSKKIDISSFPKSVKVRVEFTPKDSTQLTLGTEEEPHFGAGLKLTAETKDGKSQTIQTGYKGDTSVQVDGFPLEKPKSFQLVYFYINSLTKTMASEKAWTITLKQDGSIQ